MNTGPKARQGEPRAQADPLPQTERAELQRQGAKAAARGENASSNPMHEPVNMPKATGESTETWQQRREAWQKGHDAQSSGPGGSTPPAAPQGADDGHE
jgi:hypothetical protein